MQWNLWEWPWWRHLEMWATEPKQCSYILGHITRPELRFILRVIANGQPASSWEANFQSPVRAQPRALWERQSIAEVCRAGVCMREQWQEMVSESVAYFTMHWDLFSSSRGFRTWRRICGVSKRTLTKTCSSHTGTETTQATFSYTSIFLYLKRLYIHFLMYNLFQEFPVFNNNVHTILSLLLPQSLRFPANP